MNTILDLLISLNAAGSVVVACILLLRLVSIEVFPTKWRYGLSKMAVVLFLVPIVIAIRWILLFFTPAAATGTHNKELPSHEAHNLLTGQLSIFNPEPFMQKAMISVNTALVLFSLWAIGAIAFAVWQTYCYRKFLHKLEQTRVTVPMNSEAAKQLAFIKKELVVKSEVQLAYSSVIRSPILVGLRKPTIYLPPENTMSMDLGMVIRHEVIHLKRKDLWVKALTLGAGTLHWFNPLVHILRKDIHTWSELSCDEEVVKEMSYAERKRYGETILNVMVGSRNLPVQFCASLSGDGQLLKRRLTMMLNVKKLKKKTVIMTAAAVIAVGTIATSTAAWAAKISPEVSIDTGNPIQYKDAGESILFNGVQLLKYNALTPDEQAFVVEEELGGFYAIEGYEDLMPIDELTPDEQSQVAREEGYYSTGSITRLKEFREKFPRGTSVTITNEEDPSIPPGTSMTIRSLTPDEIAELEKRQAEDSNGERTFLEYINKLKEIKN